MFWTPLSMYSACLPPRALCFFSRSHLVTKYMNCSNTCWPREMKKVCADGLQMGDEVGLSTDRTRDPAG